MNTRVTRDVIQAYYDAYNRGSIQALREYLDPNIVCHIGGYPELIQGIEENLELEGKFRKSFSDVRFTVEDIVIEGNKAAVRRSWSMKHTGDFEGVPPTGKRLTGTAMDFFLVRDNRIVESWTESNDLSLLQQVGAIPVSEEAERSGL